MFRQFAARCRTLRVVLPTIMLLCWLLPTFVLGGYMATSVASSLRSQTESALLFGTEHAVSTTATALNAVITLARSVVYDGELSDAVQRLENGSVPHDSYYLLVRDYLDRKFSREESCTFALFFRTDASVEQLNLFDAPSANAAVLGSYWNGTLVHILRTEGDWAQVRIGKLEGYMSLSYLLHLSSTASRYDLQFSFLSSEQPLRALPDADSVASLTLPADAFVTVIGLSGSWAQIIYRGTSGFIPASALPQMLSGSWIDLLPTATPSVGFEPSSTTEPSLVSVATATP